MLRDYINQFDVLTPSFVKYASRFLQSTWLIHQYLESLEKYKYLEWRAIPADIADNLHSGYLHGARYEFLPDGRCQSPVQTTCLYKVAVLLAMNSQISHLRLKDN